MPVKAIKQKILALETPAIAWVATKKPALSKLGGLPDVPDDFLWPHWQKKPLAFLAQLDLSALPMIPPALIGLPQKGMLYFFYDQEQQTWGFNPDDQSSWRVLYTPTTEHLQKAPVPDGLEEDFIYSSVALAPQQIKSYPGFDRMKAENETLTDPQSAELEKFLDNEKIYPQYRHQMGGFPLPQQADCMELECQLVFNGFNCGSGYPDQHPDFQEHLKHASDWRLLFQIDTDDDADMMWGDCGKLYFWIREQELKQHNFSQTWMILQCG